MANAKKKKGFLPGQNKAQPQKPPNDQTPTHVAVPMVLYQALMEKLNEWALPRKETNGICVALENCQLIAVPEQAQTGDRLLGFPNKGD